MKQRSYMKDIAAGVLLIIAYIPMFIWMRERWFAEESYYNHGFLIPVVSLYIVWQRRETLKKIKPSGSMLGVVIIALGLMAHILAALLKVYFISGFSFVFVLFGLILFLYGKEMARKLIFPIFFLLVMVPLPLVFISNLTVQLKLFVAQVATFILNKIGFPSIRTGSVIKMPSSFVSVEAPCSGLRSLISLITLGLVFAYAVKGTYTKKSLLFLSSIPIALLTNMIRIVSLAIVNDLYGKKIAMGFFHDFSGFFMFGIAFMCLYGVSRVLVPDKHPTEVKP
ncbi:MAG: exosortase/archaeosortase family protein [Candidatus Omnitrophota bacterium]